MAADQNGERDESPMVLMRFRPAWAYIDGIREFGRFFCETTFGQPELAERARMVLQETLENAVKYSTTDAASELELQIGKRAQMLEITVISMPEPAHAESLRQELAELQSKSPEEGFLMAVARAAAEPGEASRLGLARMRYEGRVDLTMSQEADGRIRLTAGVLL